MVIKEVRPRRGPELGPTPQARWGVASGPGLLYGYVLPHEREGRGVSLDELPEAVANAVAVGLTYRWAELRALEMVGDELARRLCSPR